jgi:hypothetical protein
MIKILMILIREFIIWGVTVTHSVSEGSVWSIIVLKELTSDCWSHEPCQGVQDGEAACCCWWAYIGGGARIDARGGVNGGPTMVGLGAAMRACCCER